MIALAATAATSHATIYSAGAYGLTNLAGEDSTNPTSNSSIDTGERLKTDNNTGRGGGHSTGTTAGVLTSAAHACAEPQRNGGQTSDCAGYGAVNLTETFNIRSTTLAIGTPVNVTFCALASFIDTEQDGISTSSTQVDNETQAQFRTTAGANETIGGYYRFLDNAAGGPRTTRSGTLFDTEYEATLSMKVGDNFEILAGLTCDSTSAVDPGDTGMVQVESALVWGAGADNAAVLITSLDTGNRIPDLSNCNTAYVQSVIPPPIVPLPEPGAVGVGVVMMLGRCLTRRRRIVL